MEPTPNTSQSPPTPALPQTPWQRLKSYQPFLKIIDVVLALLIFGSTATFLIGVLLQAELTSLWVIPATITVGFIVGLLITPHKDFSRLTASLWRKQFTALAILGAGIVIGILLAIQNVGIANLELEDVGGLIGSWAIFAITSVLIVFVLFLTHWRTQQPTSLLYGIGRITRRLGNVVAGAAIAFVAFVGFFFTNLVLDPPDE